MDKNKIAKFIKEKRKQRNLTQEDLAEKLFVTEKAISRWETGRGTPDISLLLPLAKELNVSVSEILNGQSKVKNKDNINDVINYIEINKQGKYKLPFIISITCYIISILIFLTYLRMDYNTGFELRYICRLLMVIISSILIIIGNCIISNNYIDKLSDKKKLKKLTTTIIFIYYSILIFNMAFFARNTTVNSYNLIPFKTILKMIKVGHSYNIVINLLGNLIVFMPIEYFLIELFNINKLLKNFIISSIIILIIELIQFVFRLGVFDIDDLILCVSGMMIFYLIYIKIIKRKEKYN